MHDCKREWRMRISGPEQDRAGDIGQQKSSAMAMDAGTSEQSSHTCPPRRSSQRKCQGTAGTGWYCVAT